MEDTKSFLTSKTFIGAAITLAAGVAMLFGIDIGNTDMLIEQVTVVVGAAVAIYGRFAATKKVTM